MAESTSVVIYDPRNADPEVVALAGFLAGYTGRTREAYTLDLRQFFAWCDVAASSCSMCTAVRSSCSPAKTASVTRGTCE